MKSFNRTSAGIISILPTHMLIIRITSAVDGMVADVIPVDKPTLPWADATSKRESIPPYPYCISINQPINKNMK